MRILQVSSATTLAGGERHFIELVGGLAAKGHSVEVALRRSSPLRNTLNPVEVRIHDVALRNSLDLSTALRLRRIIESSEIDVVHAHLARDYLVCAIALRNLSRPRLIITRHHYRPLGSNYLYRRLMARADRVIAVSEYVRDQLLRDRWEGDRVMVIHNWLSPNWSHVPGARRDLSAHYASEPSGRERLRQRWGFTQALVIGSVGSLIPAKGHEDLIRAGHAIISEFPDIEFVIAGEDPSRRKKTERDLRRLIEHSGLLGRSCLLPRVEPVIDLLEALDVFVLPSWNEAFSLVLIEAMAAALPVIATNMGGPGEIVRPGVTGLLVPPKNPDALAGALRELLSDAMLRRRLGEAARKDVRARFDFGRAINQVEAVYRDVLQTARRVGWSSFRRPGISPTPR